MFPFKQQRLGHFAFPFLLLATLFACESDPYEAGNGPYANLVAECVTAKVAGGVVRSITDDGGKRLDIPDGIAPKALAEKDTTVRWMLYYNKQEPIDIVGYKPVLVLPRVEKVATDPVTLNSCWASADGQYINMLLTLGVGVADKDAAQGLGMICNQAATYDNPTAELTLYHDQAGVPQYYTMEQYVSYPWPRLAKTVKINVNTPKGQVQISLKLKD